MEFSSEIPRNGGGEGRGNRGGRGELQNIQELYGFCCTVELSQLQKTQ